MCPTGRLAWRRPAARTPPAAGVEPLQASSVCGVMARQGRCVAEAGVRDAASRAASKHAEAWVCPPASFPGPPLGSDSWSSVPPSPWVPLVRAPTPGSVPGRRPDVVGWSRRAQRAGGIFSPPAGRLADIDGDAVDVVRADGHRPSRGLPYIDIEAANRAAITTATLRHRAGSWCVTGTMLQLRLRESLLEDTLVANPDLLMPGLTLVGRQTPTAGGPARPAESGQIRQALAVRELKRGTLTREAVAQGIDYAADLEAVDLAELAGKGEGRGWPSARTSAASRNCSAP